MSEERQSFKEKFMFGLSAFPDQLTYQVFQFLIFTFYYTVIRVPTLLMGVGYIIWGIWNAINDPMLGALSERTKFRGKWGKRKLYLIISFIPLSIMMILIFFSPYDFASPDMPKFFYFLITIIIFEFFYTLFDVNVNAVFPELFPTEKKRTATNLFIKITTIIALIIGTLLPTIIIPDLVPDETATTSEIHTIQNNYFIMGIVIAIITLITTIPLLKWGIKEKEEKDEHFVKRPSFLHSLKITLSNKTFVKFVIANTMIWYCFTILPLIIPIYAEFVLGFERDAILIGIGLMLAFLIAAIFMPLFRKLGFKLGMRNALIISMVIWIGTLFPYMLISGEEFQFAFVIITALNGIPLSGALYYVDIIHADIIDEDALKFGVKRSASFYGVNAFVHRISIILVILTIVLMFGNMGWAKEFDPVVDDPFLVELGLKAIIFIFPAIALLVGIISMKFFKLHGEKLKQMREELEKHPELK